MKEKKTMSEERLFFVFCCIRSPTLSSYFLIFQTSDVANLQLSFLYINEREKYIKIINSPDDYFSFRLGLVLHIRPIYHTVN